MTAFAKFTHSLVETEAGSQTLTTRLTFNPAKPYEVTIDFAQALGLLDKPDYRTRWLVSRQLLLDGLSSFTGWVGGGDLTMRTDGQSYYIRLFNRAVITFRFHDISNFLTATYEAVPAEQEFNLNITDDDIARLIGDAS